MPKKKIDPFENPPSDLFITDVPTSDPTHFLVLNKYPVIPNHFIIATKDNKKQTHVLEEGDLEATYACLKEWGSAGNDGSLFAFFNSGDNSGASQPHRHLQFLPVKDMHEGEKSAGWDVLIRSIVGGTKIQGAMLISRHNSWIHFTPPSFSHIHQDSVASFSYDYTLCILLRYNSAFFYCSIPPQLILFAVLLLPCWTVDPNATLTLVTPLTLLTLLISPTHPSYPPTSLYLSSSRLPTLFIHLLVTSPPSITSPLVDTFDTFLCII